MKNKKLLITIGGAIIILIISFGGVFYFHKNSKINEEKNSLASMENLKKEIPKDIESKNSRSSYYLSVALDTNDNKIYGYERIKFRNNYNKPLKEVVFHLYPDSYNSEQTRPSIGGDTKNLSKDSFGGITVGEVKLGKKKLDHTQDKLNQVLKVDLNKELKPGESIQIDLDFTLTIPKGMDRLSYYSGQYSITNWYPILSIYDENSGTWDENPFYPVGESNYSDCSDYEVTINVPKGMVVATSGVEASKDSAGNREKLKFTGANIRDFDFFMSKEYKVLSKEINGVRVNSYYLKERTTAQRMLNLACDSLTYYSEAFGKYPYEEYDVVETYLKGGAMEYPTITQMGKYTKLPSEYNSVIESFLDEAVVHETGHQWWYSTVGNNEFKEPILDESFTAYSTALFFENKFGKDHPLAVKTYVDGDLRGIEPIYRSVDNFDWNSLGLYVYKLGPAVLEDLREKAGEEKTMDIFRTYYERYKLKNATFEDFLEVVKEKSGVENSDYVRKAFMESLYSRKK